MSDLVIPEVRTLARPVSTHLLFARRMVESRDDLRMIFLKYRGRMNSAEDLAAEIEPILTEGMTGVADVTEGSVRETCRFLADEYLQIGDTILIIDPDTGQVIARVTEEDLWVTDPTPHIDGSMTPGKVRLKPELEGAIILHRSDRDREGRVLQRQTLSLVQTETNIELGDHRLLATTKSGRKSIENSIREKLPALLPTYAGGRLRTFLDHLSMGNPPSDVGRSDSREIFAKVTTSLADSTSRNLNFDPLTNHLSAIANQWVRDIAKTVSNLATFEVMEVLSHHMVLPDGIWIASTDAALAMTRHWGPGVVVAPVEGSHLTRIHGHLGYVRLADFSVAAREIHDRWEIVATAKCDLYLNLRNLCPMIWDYDPEVKAVVV